MIVLHQPTSRTTKLSPPSPHLTMDSYEGSSSILQIRRIRMLLSQHTRDNEIHARYHGLTCTICVPVHRLDGDWRLCNAGERLTKSLELLAAFDPISPPLSMAPDVSGLPP
jgi:hypothetical protein